MFWCRRAWLAWQSPDLNPNTFGMYWNDELKKLYFLNWINPSVSLSEQKWAEISISGSSNCCLTQFIFKPLHSTGEMVDYMGSNMKHNGTD